MLVDPPALDDSSCRCGVLECCRNRRAELLGCGILNKVATRNFRLRGDILVGRVAVLPRCRRDGREKQDETDPAASVNYSALSLTTAGQSLRTTCFSSPARDNGVRECRDCCIVAKDAGLPKEVGMEVRDHEIVDPRGLHAFR